MADTPDMDPVTQCANCKRQLYWRGRWVHYDPDRYTGQSHWRGICPAPEGTWRTLADPEWQQTKLI